jgi:hypothetical protein
MWGAPETGAITGRARIEEKGEASWIERMCRMPVVNADRCGILKAQTDVSIGVTAVSNGQSGMGLLIPWCMNSWQQDDVPPHAL